MCFARPVKNNPRRENNDHTVDLRRRRTRNYISTTPIFFRSRIGYPLSTTTPAIVVDILRRDDGSHVERAVHISLYDMTYRFDCKSTWITTLSPLVRSGTNQSESTTKNECREDSSLINNVSFKVTHYTRVCFAFRGEFLMIFTGILYDDGLQFGLHCSTCILHCVEDNTSNRRTAFHKQHNFASCSCICLQNQLS